MDFKQACFIVEQNASSPKLNNNTLLSLYGLYKQSSEGDCNIKEPGGLFNQKAREKYKAWKRLEGLDRNKAKEHYIKIVEAQGLNSFQ